MNEAAWLLLSDPSPALRHRVLTELLDVPESDPEVTDLAQRRARSAEVAALVGNGAGNLKDAAWRLCRLAHLGLGSDHPAVRHLADEVFSHQLGDGSFPLAAFRSSDTDRGYAMIPLQAALPLRGLAAAGFATDPRAERAYDWLLAQRLDDGSWPTGVAAGQPGYVAGYRRLTGSTGCRANTEAALACLVLHPQRRTTEETRRALDLLLRRETREEWSLGSELSRLQGLEQPAGFITFYARFDLAFVLEIAGRAGASVADARVAGLADFIMGLRGPAGLWEHPTHPELTRWLTFNITLSLRRLEAGDWVGTAPPPPYPGIPAALDVLQNPGPRDAGGRP